MMKGTDTTALGDIVDLVMGQAPSSKDTNFEGRGTPFVKVGEFGPIRPVIHEWTTNPLRMARRSDVLLCVVGATCGKINLGEECAIGRSVAAIRPHPSKLDQFYLYYFMMTLVERLRSGSVGAAQTVISKDMVATVQIPCPPLAEQQRIVGLLDEAFEGLATAKANAEKNLQNARALFESHLQSVFTQRGKGWVEKNLGDLCEVFADGDWVESKDQSSEGIRLIQTGNVGQGVFKDRADKARYISEATFKRLRCTEIFDGDCLISRLPDPVGRSCILPDTGERMITAVDCTIVRFDQKQLLSKFFNHYSQSDDYIRTVAKECTGTTRNRISRSNLALTTIPVPPIAEQKRLASEFDSMREETQRLARLYELKHAALEALKKSLLHQAFAGEL